MSIRCLYSCITKNKLLYIKYIYPVLTVWIKKKNTVQWYQICIACDVIHKLIFLNTIFNMGQLLPNYPCWYCKAFHEWGSYRKFLFKAWTVFQTFPCCALYDTIFYGTVLEQAPIPLAIFRSNSKMDQNLQCSGLKCTLLITTKFCTRHDRGTVVMSAKFRCDWLSIL